MWCHHQRAAPSAFLYGRIAPGDDGPGGRQGYVVAESLYGKGTVSGPVRPGKFGWQVRLPGGTWVDCVRNNCSETLRRQTVDYWYSNGPNAPDVGPDYFRWQFRF